tara:strand:+ start:40528 stop:41415 length:888 start_codon:yes stop_codon:yes gene_type:complete
MTDFAAIQQATKRVDKVIYSRQHKPNRALVHDSVITEQPLEINLHWHSEHQGLESKVFAITMRTLGYDKFLILGLLFSEGVIKNFSDVKSISPDNADQEMRNNSWHVYLANGKQPKLTSIERFQTTYSSCGLCGATSLKALELKDPPNLLSLTTQSQFNAEDIYTLANKMRAQQQLFNVTGGVHGAALFNQQAQLLSVFEDIGRHNAVDKLVGQRVFEQASLHVEQLLVMVVSGRVSFEIVQKAVMAGISILVAVGAPSDLAIKAAQRFELTLIGFASPQSFNVYCGDWRIKAEQ